VIPSNDDDIAPDTFFRPWHVVHGRSAVKAYVASLGCESHEWLLALYVDAEYQLLAVDTVARGDVGSCALPVWKLLERGHRLPAAAFILVHNHPSGDPRPSWSDINTTNRLAHVSRELGIPLIDHLIIAGTGMMSVTDS
jgi:DNA repair protein RadC